MNRKFNLVKSGWLILLCAGIIVMGANNSQATTMGITVTDIIYALPSGGTPYYAQYWLDTKEFGKLDAFCVDPAHISLTAGYDLTDQISGESLLAAAGIASRYFDGSVLNQLSSINNQTEAKVATQLAIWNILGIADPFSGSPWEGLRDAVLGISDRSIIDSIWLARSPAGGSSYGEPSQDYLVSIPDAGIMWLLGPAFIALGILGRKKSRSGFKISSRTQSLC